jgi:hypothetical protein
MLYSSEPTKNTLQVLTVPPQNTPNRLKALYKTYQRLYRAYNTDKKQRLEEFVRFRPTFSRTNIPKTHEVVITRLEGWNAFATTQLQQPFNNIKKEEEYRKIQDLQSFQNDARELTAFYKWRTSIWRDHHDQRTNLRQECFDDAKKIINEKQEEFQELKMMELLLIIGIANRERFSNTFKAQKKIEDKL